jgi:choline kinase
VEHVRYSKNAKKQLLNRGMFLTCNAYVSPVLVVLKFQVHVIKEYLTEYKNVKDFVTSSYFFFLTTLIPRNNKTM